VCTDDQEFTTVVGPLRSVEQFLAVFQDMLVAGRHDLRARLIDLAHISSAFRDPDSPAVGVIEHGSGQGFTVAAELQAELLVGHPAHRIKPLPELVCEPGYLFRAAADAHGRIVSLDRGGLARMQSSSPRVGAYSQASGARVAVLDTGVMGSGNAMVDFTSGSAVSMSSTDNHGHGSAVAQIISALSPAADIHAVRVLGPTDNTGTSFNVLAGLAYTLWSGLFDIVNASLTSTTTSPCDHSFGRSITYIVRTCQARSPNAVPLIVAAAGNVPAKRSGYPAVVAGAIVAMALEEDPAVVGGFKRASYNSMPPQPANEQEAFGGSKTDPVGTLTTSTGATEPLYGTSFAAAAITAAHLP
jgi:subtilisin family serine protease